MKPEAVASDVASSFWRVAHGRRRAIAAGLLVTLSCGAAWIQDAKLVKSKDGKAVGYTDTPILPWTKGYHKHDPDRGVPSRVTPGAPSTDEKVGTAPSDAIMLFAGKDMSAWKPNPWKVENGELVVTEGDIETVESFGNCQVHVEWQAPNPPQSEVPTTIVFPAGSTAIA